MLAYPDCLEFLPDVLGAHSAFSNLCSFKFYLKICIFICEEITGPGSFTRRIKHHALKIHFFSSFLLNTTPRFFQFNMAFSCPFSAYYWWWVATGFDSLLLASAGFWCSRFTVCVFFVVVPAAFYQTKYLAYFWWCLFDASKGRTGQVEKCRRMLKEQKWKSEQEDFEVSALPDCLQCSRGLQSSSS